MEDWVTYWATTAQILPLVGLAVVLEVRVITSRWETWPEWLRWIQGALWSLVLLAVALLTPRALRATSPESSPPTWLNDVSEISISASLGVAVLSPAIHVAVRAFAGPLAGLFTAHPRFRFRLWRDERRVQKLRRQYNQAASHHEAVVGRYEQVMNQTGEILVRLNEVRETLEGVLADNNTPQSKKSNARRDLEDVDTALVSLKANRDSLGVFMKQSPQPGGSHGIDELEAMLKDIRRTEKEVSRNEREALEIALSSIEKNTKVVRQGDSAAPGEEG